MKVPQAIQALASSSSSSSGKRLREIIEAAPEDGEVGTVVRLISEALAASSSGKGASKGVAQENIAPPVDLSTAASVIDELFFLHPRGKQKLGFFDDRLVVKTAKQDITIMSTDVEDVVILDSIPKDTKNRVYIMLNFREDAGIKNGKTKMRAAVIQVTGDQQLDIKHPKDATKRLTGIAAVVICQAVGACGISGKLFHGSDAKVFRSCSDTAAVEAYVKARSGFLFPLQNGLCFMESPPIFIHKDRIRSVDFSRASGSSATFDFQIHLKSGAIEEFSNICRNELGCIQNWVDATKLPVGFPETSEDEDMEDARAVAVGGEEDEKDEKDEKDAGDASSDDASDEDFDPYKKRAKKQKRLKHGGDDGGAGAGGDGPDSSSSDDDDDDEEDEDEEEEDDDDVELVDEDDLKVTDLKAQLDEERQTKLKDEALAATAEREPREVPSKDKVGAGDDSDDSDEDFNEEDESDEEDGSESDSDDDVELVDEPDFKISDLKQRLDDEDDKGTATKAKKETEEPKMEEPKTEEPKKE